MNRAVGILFFSFLFLAGSCVKEKDGPGDGPKPVPGGQIVLMVHSDSQKKVTLQEDLSVNWDKGDEISLLYTSGQSRLTAQESGYYVPFTGTVPESESLSGSFALFPSDTAAILAVGSVNARFARVQTVRTVDRSRLIFPMMGTVEKKDDSFSVSMKSLGSLFEFSVERDDITNIIIRGNNNEWLSGSVAVTMSGGEPVILRKEQQPGCTELSICPDSACFAPGTYYVSVPATSFTKGIVAQLFTKDGKTARKSSPEPLSVNRAHIKPLGNIDSGLIWSDMPSDTLRLRFHGSWPFTETLPEGSYTTKPAFVNEVHDFFTRDGRRFTIFAKKGLAYLSSAESFKIQGEENDYIIFPEIEGRCLTSVKVKTGCEGTMRIPSIRTEDGSSIVDGGYPMDYPFLSTSSEYVWFLYGTGRGLRYRMNFECSGYYDNQTSAVNDYSACIQELELIYSPSERVNPSPRIWRDVCDVVPDFSRVGYQYGDKSIPDYPVGITLSSPGPDTDCTEMIQNALDKVHTGMAVLLNEGSYVVNGKITIRRSNVVLRGCGDKTVILAMGQRSENLNDRVFEIGSGISSVEDPASFSPVIENAGCGQMYVRVGNPEKFTRGDRVIVGRMPFQKWIHDLKMDNIVDTLAGCVPYNELSWKPQSFHQKWERVVVAVEGDKLYFENPLVMSLTSDYCSAYVVKTESNRNSGVGIENLKIESEFDVDVKTSTSKWSFSGGPKWYWSDENHAWYAIVFGYAEHCWVRNVTGEHFTVAVVDMNSGSKNITVSGCKSLEPVSQLTGSRRYAFYIRKGQLCLVRDCDVEKDRHAFVNGTTTCGPNVYSRCRASAMCAEIGPHQYWATGTLFDCISSDNDICLHDRAGRGGSSKTPGHGWAAANCVLWNCTMQTSPYSGVRGSIVCQSPWVSAKNYAFGCSPSNCIVPACIPYFDGFTRQEGEWTSKGTAMPDESLYEKQRAARTTPALDFPNIPEGYSMDGYYSWN